MGCFQGRDCGIMMQLCTEMVKALSAPGAVAGEHLPARILSHEFGDHSDLGPYRTANLSLIQVTGMTQSPAWPGTWHGLCCSPWLLFPAAVT